MNIWKGILIVVSGDCPLLKAAKKFETMLKGMMSKMKEQQGQQGQQPPAYKTEKSDLDYLG